MSDQSFLSGKTILVTGGTGTFGHAFIPRLLAIPGIKKIIVFIRDEFKQSIMQNEIKDSEDKMRYFLGDVRDAARLDRAFNGVDIVVHAAALKQVPAIEYNPLEAIKTNVLGTQNVVDAALNNNVEKVLFVSSDKAVYPINLYGATKLCAEKLVVAANAYSDSNKAGTKFSVVRYGNVIGSRGSIVELIEKQRPTGAITLTDDRMTRFWIKVSKVMNVIFETLERMEGGEIFVPKMKSLKVIDVVKTLASECAINVIGIRPGEKLHEILITENEAKRTRDVGNFYAIVPEITNKETSRVLPSYNTRPLFNANSIYMSNHGDFLLPIEKAKEVLES